jgi:hypothetical protein
MRSVNGAATTEEALETRQVQIREDSCFRELIDECIRVNRIIDIDEITPEAMINHENKWCKNDLEGPKTFYSDGIGKIYGSVDGMN